jgi:hypothetical protein
MRWLLSLSVLFLGCLAVARAAGDEPPQEVRLEEKKFETLSNRDTDPLGVKALALQPQKWKHAETDHFIIHYRRATEAQKVVREIEYTLWFVARSLGAGKERYAKKSHVYVFQDEREWIDFRSEAGFQEWATSVAHGDNLFLHVGGVGEPFDSATLAHETTHAVVARLYPGKRWPHWLNEGFAQYMSTASQAARKHVWAQGMQRSVAEATYSPTELVAMTDYPKDKEKVWPFYQSAEKLVRFLNNEYPQDRFPRFIDAIVDGVSFQDALVKVYGDRVKDYPAFLKQYDHFTK